MAFENPRRLTEWCRESGTGHAIGGGFFDRQRLRPLGELRIKGSPISHTPFSARWRGVRGTLHVEETAAAIAPRNALPLLPTGDLLQAGPILVRDGTCLMDGNDREGFTADQAQFDGDITSRRFQRAAIGIAKDEFLLLAADGASSHPGFVSDENAGLTLEELAETMRRLGAIDALNLDGGGSASLVHSGKLVNRPLAGEHDDVPPDTMMPEGRPIHTAIVFERT